MITRDVWWSETIIVNLKKEGISDFHRITIGDYEIIDKKYLRLTLELSKVIMEEEQDEWQKER